MVLRLGNRYRRYAKIRLRLFARQCLDWSEPRNHLAGALGSALAEHLFDRGGIERVRESRAVRITELGRRELERRLGVAWPGPTLL